MSKYRDEVMKKYIGDFTIDDVEYSDIELYLEYIQVTFLFFQLKKKLKGKKPYLCNFSGADDMPISSPSLLSLLCRFGFGVIDV